MKTSLAPGSQVVAEYLDKSGLQKDLDKLGFNLVGFGCTTCIGNSGPLPPEISKAINESDLVAAAVLSGNRNFEGRVNADVRANYLASPPLVVAYAIAGSMKIDMAKDPLGVDQKGKKVFLKDIWPSNKEIGDVHHARTSPRQMFTKQIRRRVQGRRQLAQDRVKGGLTYAWDASSTYVQNPPYFEGMKKRAEAARRHRRRARAGAVPRLDHHRPHLAGRLDQGQLAGRRISGRSQGQARRTSTSTARGAAITK